MISTKQIETGFKMQAKLPQLLISFVFLQHSEAVDKISVSKVFYLETFGMTQQS